MTATGVFYPRGAESAEDRLAYYASQFPLVEVDATYYALPSRRVAELWRERTPPDFTFDVKAHALMTGQPTETKRLPKSIREALPDELAAKPRVYGKDLPRGDRSTSCTPTSRMPSSRCARPDSWARSSSSTRNGSSRATRAATPSSRPAIASVAWTSRSNSVTAPGSTRRTPSAPCAFLEDHALPFVMVDEPQGFKTSVPHVYAVTSPRLALVRFHGRNAATWEAKGVSPAERFRYLYDRDELAEWAPRIADAASRSEETHVLMNNCYANYGAVNARQIAKLLEDLAVEG